MEPFYEALKRRDWAVISRYCALTADSNPRRFYYSADMEEIKAGAVWRKLRSFSATYTDPKTGKKPDECVLIIGSYDVPYKIETPNATEGSERIETYYSMGRVRMDLWLRDADQWRVIPELEISHTSALQVNNVPFEGRGLGKQFNTLAEIDVKAKADREKGETSTSRVKTILSEMQTKFQKLTGNRDLTPEQQRAGFNKITDEAREAAAKANKEYEAAMKVEIERQRLEQKTRTLKKP